jgi:cytochrome c peroxidase
LLGPACDDTGVVIQMSEASSASSAGSAEAIDWHAVEDDLNPRLLRRFVAIGARLDRPSEARIALGRSLYFDPRLSSSGQVSCNSCHPLADYGATHESVSTGVHGRRGTRNAPSTYNAAGHFRQFWDGRVATLEEQARQPLQDNHEMEMPTAALTQALKGINEYADLFEHAFPGESESITLVNVASAIAEFERGLITPARWDRYLEGERTALSVEEKEGARLFANAGCMVCHSGAYLGAATFEKLGVREPWPRQGDRGRGALTRNPIDDMIFKVPSLRNVTRTAPYFHDGSTDSLAEAVELMARYQLGLELLPSETRAIVIWLDSLTGVLPEAYIAPPALPGWTGP